MMTSESQIEASDSHTPKSRTTRRRLTQSELGFLLAFRAEGMTQVQIAQRLSCDQSTISLALKRLGGDTTSLATHHLKAGSYAAAKRAVRVAKHGKDDAALKAARLVLEGSGVINANPLNGLGGVTIQVGVVLPGIRSEAKAVVVAQQTPQDVVVSTSDNKPLC